MKNIELNPLNSTQRRLLQFGIVIALGIFLLVFFLLAKKPPIEPETKNNTVYIENSILHVFDDTISIADYPNRIAMHYPYLLVIKPGEQITHIYNLENKNKEKDVKEALLDYFDGNVLKNSGKSTFLNEFDLDVLCEKGFIKSDQKVLCLTKVNKNTVENKLISINTATKKQKEIYVSKDIVTDFNVINNVVYIGEINLYNKKNYIIIDGEKIEVPSVINLIYEMDKNPYYATFKGEFSKEDVYYEVSTNQLKGQNKILLYE